MLRIASFIYSFLSIAFVFGFLCVALRQALHERASVFGDARRCLLLLYIFIFLLRRALPGGISPDIKALLIIIIIIYLNFFCEGPCLVAYPQIFLATFHPLPVKTAGECGRIRGGCHALGGARGGGVVTLWGGRAGGRERRREGRRGMRGESGRRMRVWRAGRWAHFINL